jgi:hypothetical protein
VRIGLPGRHDAPLSYLFDLPGALGRVPIPHQAKGRDLACVMARYAGPIQNGRNVAGKRNPPVRRKLRRWPVDAAYHRRHDGGQKRPGKDHGQACKQFEDRHQIDLVVGGSRDYYTPLPAQFTLSASR